MSPTWHYWLTLRQLPKTPRGKMVLSARGQTCSSQAGSGGSPRSWPLPFSSSEPHSHPSLVHFPELQTKLSFFPPSNSLCLGLEDSGQGGHPPPPKPCLLAHLSPTGRHSLPLVSNCLLLGFSSYSVLVMNCTRQAVSIRAPGESRGPTTN